MYAALGRFGAQIGTLLGLVLALAIARHTTVSLWLVTPVSIALIYLSVLAVSFAIQRLRY
ncbi:hypothetical protein C5F48_09670 [Cereibacter changlensis JA139]|uniref:Uncharacterized protein n=2 Tax=Cereibacter changlensis TaxID=402884 RepID=A0A2T4JVI0_9RHOB|nr:hypothetical protein C5F48_09670 [Cereibacter changlensis JA139]PZX51805.1 hypothetical protein LX76_03158 [Cereibacter changlensis]